MNKKSLVYNFAYYDEVELIKTFPIPYYIGKINDMSVSIVYRADKQSQDLPEYYKGVRLCPLKFPGNGRSFSFLGEWYFFWYFYLHAKEIDVLIRPHFSYQTAIIALIYKLRNPNGILYIFSEGYGLWLSLFRKNTLITRIKNYFIRKVLYKTCEIANKVSAELVDIYNYYKAQKPFLKDPEKLIFMRLGIDEESLEKYKIKEIPVCQKEKLIISVGRHGSRQKNTELFLEALKHVDLKDYSVVFIGPIEKSECCFQNYIDTFFEQNKYLEKRVRFIGAIYDKEKLYTWFNRARVFVHTSVYESYGIVIGEAFRFNNYIISTDVGCAKDIISMGMGELFPMNDVQALATSLQRVIDNDTDILSIYENKQINNQLISWENEIKKLGDF